MAERTIRVRLLADIASYRAGMARAAKSTTDFGRQLSGQGNATAAQMQTIGRSAGIMAIGLGAGLGFAAKATMGFDKQISELGAVSSASAKDLDTLRNQAIKAGQATVFSASEAAKAQTELAKAGVSTADILSGGLTGALSLASAGSLDLGSAATIAAQAMNTFGLSGGDVGHIADVLAAGANKSAAEVGDMGLALAQSGLVAAQLGVSLDETVGVLAMFAQNGLRGSDAGTSFKTMLQRLNPQSKEAKDTMESLGISMFDSAGNFIGVERAAGVLQKALSGLTEEQRASALSTIFGTDAIRAAALFYKGGADGVREWTAKVDDSGFAARVAGEKMDNLAGDLERLRGSIDTALIQGGSQATGALRSMAGGADTMVQGFSEIPEAAQAVGVGLAAVATAGLGVVGVVGTMAPKVQAAKAALEGMGTGGEFVSRNMGKMAVGVGVATAAVALFSYVQGVHAKKAAEDAAATDAFAEAIRGAGSETKGTIDRVRALLVEAPEIARMMNEAGISASELGTALSGNDKEWASMRTRLLAAAQAMGIGGVKLDAYKEGLDRTRASAVQGAKDAKDVGTAVGGAGDAAAGAVGGIDANTAALEDNSTEAEKAAKATKEYQDAVSGAVSPLFDMLDAQKGVKDAQDGVADAQRDAARAAVDVTKAQQGVSDALLIQADAAKAAEEGVQGLLDAQRASIDPLFGMIDALIANRDALKAAKEEGAGLGEALDVAKSAQGVKSAAITLAGAIETGDVSVKDAKQSLAEWVKQGLITSSQAKLIGKAFDDAAAKATKLEGANVKGAIAQSVHAADMAAANDRAEALTEANSRLADAQLAAADAQDRIGDAMAQAAPAALQMTIAAIALNAAMQQNPEFVDNAKAAMQAFADQGLITQTQADKMAASFDDVAESLDGIAALDGMKVAVELEVIHSGIVGQTAPRRWGGVDYAMAGGGMTAAHIANRTTIKYAEPATGGEAYIPRRGNQARNRAILDEAAGWAGLEVINPRSMSLVAAGGGVSRHDNSRNARIDQIIVNYPAPEPMSAVGPRMARKIAAGL